jgi:hypothetical protein
MRPIRNCICLLAVFGLGVFFGQNDWIGSTEIQAQGVGGAASDEVTREVTAAYTALQNAKSALAQEDRYTSATVPLNVSAIMSGGVDAIGDLESGRGVDPETFAALYAEQATDEIAAELEKDELGRLTYKGKVVRMYSVSRLKQMFQERLRFAGTEE